MVEVGAAVATESGDEGVTGFAGGGGTLEHRGWFSIGALEGGRSIEGVNVGGGSMKEEASTERMGAGMRVGDVE